MNKNFFYILIILTILSCKKDDVEVLKSHANYFQLTPGRYTIFNVEEMYHDEDLIIKHDTIRYQLKTVIGEEYTDNAGRIGRKYYRYQRTDTSFEWEIEDVWVALQTNTSGELIEENQRIVKLSIPVTSNKTWDLNAFNSLEKKEASYENLHQKAIIKGNHFDSTLKVKQAYFKSLIDYQNQYEIYATNIGLVGKVYKDLIIDNFDTLDVQKGNELHYNLVEYGIE
jgi:hypothetical protein